MGEARLRGTFEERKAKAIKEMRVKTPKFINLDARPKGLVALAPLTRWLVYCAAVNTYNSMQEIDKDD